MPPSRSHRIGFGEDAHRLAPGRILVIGNLAVPDAPRGADAHSDGDVLLHALADALLSALALGDIGRYYPPSDPVFEGIDSAEILAGCWARVLEVAPRAEIVNLAVTVTLDRPKLGRLREAIADRVAELLALSSERVGLTFKTSEGLAPDHIQARAAVLLDLDPEPA